MATNNKFFLTDFPQREVRGSSRKSWIDCKMNEMLNETLNYTSRFQIGINSSQWRQVSYTYLSNTSRIMKMQNAKGHARYRSSACGKVNSSVFFKSAQVTLWGSQNLSFQNQTKIPAMVLKGSPGAPFSQVTNGVINSRCWAVMLRRQISAGFSVMMESVYAPPVYLRKEVNSAFQLMIGSPMCHSFNINLKAYTVTHSEWPGTLFLVFEDDPYVTWVV